MAIDGGPVTIVGCTVATNAAQNSGGGLRVGGGTTSVSLSTFIGNTVRSRPTGVAQSYALLRILADTRPSHDTCD